MKTRIEWVDSVKGIGMLLVIFGHFMNSRIVDVIYIFHIPLFFIISGYLLNVNHGYRTFFESKFRGMLLPYFSLGIPIIIAQLIFKKETVWQDSILHYLVQKKYTTMWFLSCLFIVNVLVFLFLKIFRNCWIVLGISFVMSSGIYVFTYLVGNQMNMPWNINTACYASLYFVIGYLMKELKFDSKVFNLSRIKGFLLLVIGLFIGGFAQYITGNRYDMFYNQYGLFGISIIAAVICTIGLICIVQNNHIIILSYIGKNSMIYFAFHQTIFKQIFMTILPSWTIFYQILSMVLTIICITILSELINKTFFRYCLGKK